MPGTSLTRGCCPLHPGTLGAVCGSPREVQSQEGPSGVLQSQEGFSGASHRDPHVYQRAAEPPPSLWFLPSTFNVGPWGHAGALQWVGGAGACWVTSEGSRVLGPPRHRVCQHEANRKGTWWQVRGCEPPFMPIMAWSEQGHPDRQLWGPQTRPVTPPGTWVLFYAVWQYGQQRE